MEEICAGLLFPEGPIAMSDGSVILVEIARGTQPCHAGRYAEVVADLGGGPNGRYRAGWRGLCLQQWWVFMVEIGGRYIRMTSRMIIPAAYRTR